VNSVFYCHVLRLLRENVRRRRPELWRAQTWLLHYDHAPSHISVLTQQFLAEQKWVSSATHRTPLIWHPVTLILFPKMKLKLKGRRFDTIRVIQAISQRVLDTLTEKDFQEAFQKWRRRWDECLHAGRNYFEGDGCR
jgi:hypothetical protein